MVKTILSEPQQFILNLLFAKPGISRNFYLSGGTALAEYYLHHRYSEDLDFFALEEVDTMAIQTILKSISQEAKIKSIDFQQSFNRNLFFLHLGSEVIKTEFTYYPFTQVETPQTIDHIRIDSLIDIAVNKTFTLYQKPRSRDFIDLYLIMKNQGWVLNDLRKKARAKFDTPVDPLQLAQQLLEATNVKDYPRMVAPLKPQEWISFWEKEANNLKSEVLI